MFKMASIAMLIGGALANALAFIGSSYLFLRLCKDSIETERKRQDAVIEQLLPDTKSPTSKNRQAADVAAMITDI